MLGKIERGNEGRPGGIVARRAGYAAGMPPAKERALEQLVLVDGVSEGVHGIYKRLRSCALRRSSLIPEPT